MHVERQISERDLGFGAGDANGADEQAHLRLLISEQMLDQGANFGFGGIALPDIRQHWPALGFSAVDAADPDMGLQPAFVALAAVGRIGPDIRGGVVLTDNVAQHAAVVARAIGDLALADESEGPADRDAALVTKAWDRDARLRISHSIRASATLFCAASTRALSITIGS